VQAILSLNGSAIEGVATSPNATALAKSESLRRAMVSSPPARDHTPS
jgi:hypothetical protein